MSYYVRPLYRHQSQLCIQPNSRPNKGLGNSALDMHRIPVTRPRVGISALAYRGGCSTSIALRSRISKEFDQITISRSSAFLS